MKKLFLSISILAAVLALAIVVTALFGGVTAYASNTRTVTNATEIYELVRSVVPFCEDDHELRVDVSAMNELIRSGKIETLVARMLPDFR